MSNKKLEALKKMFKSEKDNSQGKRRGDYYPFWEMDINKRAVVRILPDKNPEGHFYVDKMEHTLSINEKNEKIPCLQMYKEKCPICELSKEFYKAEGNDSVNGKYYYRKKPSLVRVLVIEDPLPPDPETGETCEGKVMTTQLSYQLMQKIKEEICSDELEYEPWDLENGYNFIIKKTAQGRFGTYSVGSGFARRPSPIDESLLDQIELIDLETLLPKNPGYEYVKRKLDAHLNGTEETDDSDDSDDSDEEQPPLRKPVVQEKSIKSSKLAKIQKLMDDDDDDVDNDDDDDEQEEPVMPKASQKKKPVVEENDDDEDEEDILAAIRRSRKK